MELGFDTRLVLLAAGLMFIWAGFTANIRAPRAPSATAAPAPA